MIPLLMVCFETLNPTTKTCMSTNHDDLEEKGNIFKVGAFLKSFLQHLSQDNYFCSTDYPYLLTHAKILLFGSANHEGQFPNIMKNCVHRNHITLQLKLKNNSYTTIVQLSLGYYN